MLFKRSRTNEPKNRSIGCLLLVGALCGLICGPPAFAEDKTKIAEGKTKIEDENITAVIETELLIDDEVNSHMIDVTTKNGVVEFDGNVGNLLAKDRAAALAATVKGVKSIVNRLKVEPVVRTDEQVRDDVVEALLEDPATDSYETTVSVKDGVVTIEGVVESWAEKNLSEKVVKGVTGVKDVDNDIKVVYEAERPDVEIKADIEQLLTMDPWIDNQLIDVSSVEGEVFLSGVVGSLQERNWARDKSWVQGVINVDVSGLKIQPWAEDFMKRDEKNVSKSDEEIEDAIKLAFKCDPRVKSFNPFVRVLNGHVFLKGTVDNLTAKMAAEEDAKNTVGVEYVSNNLKVRPVILPSNPKVAENVRSALARDPYVERHEISLSVINNKVYMYGAVDSYFEKRRAEEVAGRVNGVVEVDNNLTVDYAWAWKSDREIKKDIESELFWSPFVDEDDVNVKVKDGTAVLTGSVESWMEFGAATENAFDGGSKSVRNKLKVEGSDVAYDRFYPTYEHYHNFWY